MKLKLKKAVRHLTLGLLFFRAKKDYWFSIHTCMYTHQHDKIRHVPGHVEASYHGGVLMASFTIAGLDISQEQLWEYYSAAKATYSDVSWVDLDYIFSIAIDNRDRFPGVNRNRSIIHTCK